METRLFRTIVLFGATVVAAPSAGCSGATSPAAADAGASDPRPTNERADAGDTTDLVDAGTSSAADPDPTDAAADPDSAAPPTDAAPVDASDADPSADAGGDACVLVDGGCVNVDAGWPSTK